MELTQDTQLFQARPYAVVALGETMIRISPPGHERLETAAVFHPMVGGAESNVLISLARLGLRVAWVSRLTNNPLGRRIAGELAFHGVDVSHVVWTDQDRIGLNFVEAGVPPRPTSVIYDRAHSAMSRMTVTDMDFDLLGQTQLFYTTGITPALSGSCCELVTRCLEEAQARATLTALDVNYRSKLWPPDQARKTLEPLAAQADILFCTRHDAQTVFNLSDPPEDMVQALCAVGGRQVVVLTLGAEGAIALTRDGELHRRAAIPTTPVDRIGGGDAFAAGFLFGFLTAGVEAGLAYGTALASLKYTLPGDFAAITRAELESVLAGSEGSIQR